MSTLAFNQLVSTVGANTDDAYEDDNSLINAKYINVGEYQYRSINYSDVDYIRFDIVTSGIYDIILASNSSGQSIRMALYNSSSGSYLDDYYFYQNETINLELIAGSYYLILSSSAIATQLYEIGLVNSAFTGDSFEPDNSYQDATFIAANSPQVHSNHGFDQDWFTFTAPSDTIFSITTSGDTYQDYYDTYVYLYDSSITEIASNDDYFGLFSNLTYYSDVSQTFYFKIESYNSLDTIDSYQVNLEFKTPSPDKYETDTSSTPILVEESVTYFRNIYPVNEQDFFNFSMSRDGSLSLDVNRHLATGFNSLNFSIFDDLSNLIYSNYFYYGFIDLVELPAGEYQLIFDSQYNDYISYEATFEFILADNGEPNNDMNNPYLLNGSSNELTFHQFGDQDWYQININQSGSYLLQFFSISYYDHGFSLYDQDFQLLNSMYFYDRYHFEFLTVNANSTYYIHLNTTSEAHYYSLEITEDTTENYEPNDNFSSANEIVLNSVQTHGFSSWEDTDYTYFYLPDSATVEISISVPDKEFYQSTGIYINIELFNSDYIQIDESYGDSTPSLSGHYSSGTYYIMTYHNSDSSVIPQYNLTLSVKLDPNNPDDHDDPVDRNTDSDRNQDDSSQSPSISLPGFGGFLTMTTLIIIPIIIQKRRIQAVEN